MALLGVQLVISLIMLSIIQKVGSYYSFARWLMCSTGLIRYLHPTDAELRQLANLPKEKWKPKRNGRHHDNDQKHDTFHVPRNLDIGLETVRVSRYDVVHLKYYVEYQWLLDFALYSLLVYFATEVYHSFYPQKNEINLSMIWCILVIGFAIKHLLSLTLEYFKGEESIGERSTCVVMGFVFMLTSMVVLIVDETVLELDLENAYTSFNGSASNFLARQGIDSSGPASKIILKFFLAVNCGLLGALYTFPGMRIAKMHWDLLKYKNSKLAQMLLNVNFVLPFILVILWIKPISRNYLTERIFQGATEPLLKPETFETIRVIAIILAMLLKLVLTPWNLQAYLNMAYHRIEEQKKEAGRITNIDLQKRVAAIFYYLCVAALQYLTPVIICLFLTFMYKTLGGFSWNGTLLEDDESCLAEEVQIFSEDSILKSTKAFHLALDNLKSVFTTTVFRGLLGFATWWSCFVYFATTSFGLVYQSYFNK